MHLTSESESDCFFITWIVSLAHFSVGYIFTYMAFLIALHQANLVNSFMCCIRENIISFDGKGYDAYPS